MINILKILSDEDIKIFSSYCRTPGSCLEHNVGKRVVEEMALGIPGGSYAVTDWNEGSKIMFLSPDGDGMNSVIQRKIPNELMSFKHQNVIKQGAEQSTSDEDMNWEGVTENYYLHEEDGITQLRVEIETTEEYVKYFETAFPMALKKIKDLAEVPKGMLVGGR